MGFTNPTHADLVSTCVIVIAQILIGWLLFVDLRPRSSPGMFRTAFGVLVAFWGLTLLGMFMNQRELFHFFAWIPWRMRGFLLAASALWGFTSTLAVAAYAIWRFFARKMEPEHSPERRRLLQAAGTAAVAAPFAITAFGALVERTNFHVKEIELPVPNLHPDLDGFQVVQLSDLHVSPYLSVRQAARVVDMANELKPNLMLVTGDLISFVGDPLDETIREIARLRSDVGTLGCLGNHEAYAECQDYTTEKAARLGVDFLRGESRQLRWGKGVLNVAGVDHQRFTMKDHYLEGAEDLIMPGAANILLSHNPDVFPVAVRKGYDAMFAGHTHGGQVTIEILNQTLNFARFYTRYVAGLYRIDGRSCYVTTGIGTIGMPTRLGARPEITLARLRRA